MKIKYKFLIIGAFISLACGPDLPIYEFYSLFYNDTAANEKYKDYSYGGNNIYLNYNDYYDDPELKDDDLVHDAIMQSWVDYTGNKFKIDAVNLGFGGNKDFILKLDKIGKKNAAKYMGFYNECKSILISELPYDEEEQKKIKLSATQFYSNAKPLLAAEPDPFLIERYLYLMSRLDIKTNEKTDFVELYKKYESKLDQKSPLYPLLKSNYAGSLRKTGNLSEAFYLFSQIFHDYPSQANRAFRSIADYKIPYSSDVDKLCKNEAEKANVYALMSLQPKIDGLPFIQKIYNAKPDYDNLDLLFNREINKMEQMYFSTKKKRFDYWEKNKDQSKAGGTQLKKLHEFADNVIKENKRDLSFWHLSNSYFHLLNNNAASARQSLGLASPNKKINARQIEALGLCIDLNDPLIKDDASIAKLIGRIKPLRQIKRMEDASMLLHCGELLRSKLSIAQSTKIESKSSIFSGCNKTKEVKVDYSQGNKARLFAIELLTSFQSDSMSYALFGQERQVVYDRTKLDYLEAFEMGFLNNPPTNAIDQGLYSAIELDKDGFYKALGRKYVLARNFEKAALAYSKLSKEGLASLDYYNSSNGNDPLLQLQRKIPNASAYCKEIAESKKLAESGNEEAILKYATHLYNVSYYGNAWLLSKSYKSSSEPKDQREYPTGWSDDYMAEQYYTLTDINQLISQSKIKDKELQAKLAYLQLYMEPAKLNIAYHKLRNAYWNTYPEYNEENNSAYEKWEKEGTAMDDKHNSEYTALMTKLFNVYYLKYKETAYGNKVIRECVTIHEYIGD
jgi:hypothetical protein